MMVFFYFLLAVLLFWFAGNSGWKFGRDGRWPLVVGIAVLGGAIAAVTIGYGGSHPGPDGINYWNMIWLIVAGAMFLALPVGAMIGRIERRRRVELDSEPELKPDPEPETKADDKQADE